MGELAELRQAEIEYCRDNVSYYVRTYCHYEDKDAEELIQPFDMWEMQEQALESIHEHRLNVILKARQLGFSWLVISYASNVMLTKPGRTVIGLSRTEDEAAELVRRLGVEFLYMPELIREKKSVPKGWDGPTYEQTTMKLTIHFPSMPDSVFMAFPSSPGSVRSFTADLVIFDEWAFQQWAEEIWTSAGPTINRPTGGKFIGLSTNVRGSLFERTFCNKDNGFNKIFIPWYADPRRDEEWYEKTKRMFGGDITQEYPATIEEALSAAGGAYFPEVTESTHITKEPIEGNVRRYCCIDYGLDMFSAHWVMVNEDNYAQVYREFDASDKTIGAACDILHSLSKDEVIEAYLAPPDLWNRSQESGKSRFLLFYEGGITLTKTSNDFSAGCAGMKQWLECTNSDGSPKTPRLTIVEDSAPNLYRCLTKIQKDKKRPNVYAKEPHDLTHDVDSLRTFCVYHILPASSNKNKKMKKWTSDMHEDYKNANKAEKAYLISIWGEPK